MSGWKAWAKALKRDVHAVWLAARDRNSRWYVKAAALCIAGYALSPIDLIPDFIPVLGLLDELVILPLAIWAVVRMIPPEDMARYRAAASAAAERPVSRAAAYLVILVWAVLLVLSAWLVMR